MNNNNINKVKNSAGIILYKLSQDNQILFLLLRAYSYWDSSKGEVDDQLGFKKTAIRELFEEASIKQEDIDIKSDEYYSTEKYSNPKKIANYFLAELINLDVDIVLQISSELGKPEHDEFRWVNYEEAKKLVGPRVLKSLDWAINNINLNINKKNNLSFN